MNCWMTLPWLADLNMCRLINNVLTLCPDRSCAVPVRQSNSYFSGLSTAPMFDTSKAFCIALDTTSPLGCIKAPQVAKKDFAQF